MNDLPDWAQFDADMYQEIPDDWRGLDVGYELCEHSIYCDPDCGTAPEVEGLAAMVVAHRLEIVALRKELAEAQADNARQDADLEKVRTHQRAHIARLRNVRRAARQYRRQLDFAAAERHEAADREIARLRGELSQAREKALDEAATVVENYPMTWDSPLRAGIARTIRSLQQPEQATENDNG